MRPLLAIPFLAIVPVAVVAQDRPVGSSIWCPFDGTEQGPVSPCPLLWAPGDRRTLRGTSALNMARLNSSLSAYKENAFPPAPNGWFSPLLRAKTVSPLSVAPLTKRNVPARPLPVFRLPGKICRHFITQPPCPPPLGAAVGQRRKGRKPALKSTPPLQEALQSTRMRQRPINSIPPDLL